MKPTPDKILDTRTNPQKLLTVGREGSTLNSRGTPIPNQTATAFSHTDAFQTAIPNEFTHATNSPPNVGRDAKFANVYPRLYDVKSGDPLASGLFSTDQLDSRIPESSAWNQNHLRIGTGKTGPALISKIFDDLKLPTGLAMESSHNPANPIEEKTAYLLGWKAAINQWR